MRDRRTTMERGSPHTGAALPRAADNLLHNPPQGGKGGISLWQLLSTLLSTLLPGPHSCATVNAMARPARGNRARTRVGPGAPPTGRKARQGRRRRAALRPARSLRAWIGA